MRTISVLCGMIASGKSTYALQLAKRGAMIVSHDALSEMAHGEYRYEQELRACYREAEEALVLAYLRAGRDAVVDRTHLTRESRERWIRFRREAMVLADDPNIRIVAVAFPIAAADEHAWRRVRSDDRGRPIADWLRVAQHHAVHAAADPLSADEGFDEIIRMEGYA